MCNVIYTTERTKSGAKRRNLLWKLAVLHIIEAEKSKWRHRFFPYSWSKYLHHFLCHW